MRKVYNNLNDMENEDLLELYDKVFTELCQQISRDDLKHFEEIVIELHTREKANE